MRLLERILFATDFSDAAGTALQAAISVAKTFHSEIIPLYVMPEIPDSPLASAMVKEAATSRLEKIQGEIKQQGVNAGDLVVDAGAAFDQIISWAETRDVNVIMIGSGEKTSENAFRLGITAENVIRKARKPVWVVKKDHGLPVKRILCPVDFSECSRRALTNAIHLARNFEAELTVFTAIEPLSNIYQTLVKVPAKLGSTYKKDQKVQFERFLDDFDFHNVQWKKATCEGNPPEEILNAARAAKSDLIVMGSQGRTGVARMLIGSVAEKVIREMPCSVVTVKSEHAVRLRLETEIADIEARFKAGQELLDKGFPAEALRQFEAVVTKDMTFAPGWEGLAVAHNRLGQKEEAKECKQRAQHIRKKLWEKRVEAEIRAKYVLWGKKSKKF